MPDERRARQMVQYHNEGEHVFPEPECPSCCAGRLDEALRRAAEMVAVCEPMYIHGFPQGNEAVTQVMPDALEGWAAAIRALRQFFDGGDHMTSCNLSVLVGEDCTDVTCSPFCREVRNAVATFIKAMLGGRDAGRDCEGPP